MIATPSYAWRGPKGAGKRTELLGFLRRQATADGQPFELKHSVLYLNRPANASTATVLGGADGGGDDDDDDELSGKCIPYEESALHLGFDCARMSMSDKVFLQSILGRWTGQQDVCLLSSTQCRPDILYCIMHTI